MLVKGFCVSGFCYGFMSGWPKSEMLLVVALKYLSPVLQKPDSIYYPTKSQLSVLHFERFWKVLTRMEMCPRFMRVTSVSFWTWFSEHAVPKRNLQSLCWRSIRCFQIDRETVVIENQMTKKSRAELRNSAVAQTSTATGAVLLMFPANRSATLAEGSGSRGTTMWGKLLGNRIVFG